MVETAVKAHLELRCKHLAEACPLVAATLSLLKLSPQALTEQEMEVW
jgi:hypothetical protein